MISVIVPIYNAERYLRRALDSILSQTHKDWEAILVDDGSTDDCPRIVDNYAARDKRFKPLHKTNGGHSDARNAGMQQAGGEFILFLDADDFMHPQLMELSLQAMMRDNSDIVCFTYDRRYRTRNLIRHFLHLPDSNPHYLYYKEPPFLVTDNIFLYATEYSRPHDIERRWAVKHCQAWRCLYKAYVIKGIRFIPNISYEDFPWWSEVLLHIHRATILNLPLYFYYPNPRSYILSANQSHKADSIRQGIEASKHIYAAAPADKRKAWERNFLVPFQEKLRRKTKR